MVNIKFTIFLIGKNLKKTYLVKINS